MPKVLAFTARGRFAAHRDPSVTTHQLVYYAPPKSAVVGMVGAILGTPRSETGDLYSPEYRELLSDIRIGVGMLNGSDDRPQKVLFGTNRRPLKGTGHMKPTKSEIIENPNYRIYVSGSEDTLSDIKTRIDDHNPTYPVYFGHAYCQASLGDARTDMATEIGEGETALIGSTVLKDPNGEDDFELDGEQHIIVENKMVHSVRDDVVTMRSMPHMIPLRGTTIEVIGVSALQTFMRWGQGKTHGDEGAFSVF